MEHAQLLQQFKAFTGCEDENQAKFFLESSSWNLELAVGTYLEQDGHAVASPPQPPQTVSRTKDTSGHLNELPVPPGRGSSPDQSKFYSRHPPMQTSSQSQPAPSAPKAKKAAAPTRGLRTLADMRKGAEEDDSDEEDGVHNYFAGGGERSGQVIQDPREVARRQERKARDAAENIIKTARDRGGPPPPPEPEQNPTFAGTGYRLGNTSAPTPPEAIVPAQPQVKRTRTLTFYRNGFTVDDLPFRSFDDPANAAFLRDIEQGYCPRELQAEAGDKPVSINLVDKKREDYVAPAQPKVKAFSGQGYALGATSSAPATPAAAAPAGAVVAKPSGSSVAVDETKPVTTLQIRLADGTRLVAKFNHHHTVQDIRNFVSSAAPLAGGTFELRTAFPPAVLADLSATISSAGLLNASIVQRLV